MTIGYTTGVYDLFHIGHLNLLKNAKGMCDKLIVGVTVDELVAYKGKRAMIPFEDRPARSWAPRSCLLAMTGMVPKSGSNMKSSLPRLV